MKSISKSSYCSGMQCPKILWLKTFMPEEAVIDNTTQVKFNSGRDVGDLAKQYFGDYKEIKINFDDRQNSIPLAVEQTKQIIADRKTQNIAEATFTTENTFCMIDILRVLPNGEVEIVEVKSATSVKEQYYDDVAFQYHVLTKCGYKVAKASLMHINSRYVRHGEINIQQLFTLEDITDKIIEKQSEIEPNLDHFLEISNREEEPQMEIGQQCNEPYPCVFHEYCWTEKDFEEHKKHFEDKCNKPKIQEFLDSLSYPLYFLDFETFQPVIPLYENSRPYQQIPFQYSLHILDKKGGNLTHKEFLADNSLTDPRPTLAKQLCKDIPKNTCVVAYNTTFEKGRIAEMAEIFPELNEHLLAINKNMVDLMKPFRISFGKTGVFYCQEMQGSFSIKTVFPALCPDFATAYNELPLIHNGGEAMEIFPVLHLETPEKQQKIRNGLLEYCRLDTFATVKVLEKVYEFI